MIGQNAKISIDNDTCLCLNSVSFNATGFLSSSKTSKDSFRLSKKFHNGKRELVSFVTSMGIVKNRGAQKCHFSYFFSMCILFNFLQNHKMYLC